MNTIINIFKKILRHEKLAKNPVPAFSEEKKRLKSEYIFSNTGS